MFGSESIFVPNVTYRFNAGTTEVLNGGPEFQSIKCLSTNTWSDLAQGPLRLEDKVRISQDVCEGLGILEQSKGAHVRNPRDLVWVYCYRICLLNT
jgi:hypothetical protein